MERGRILILGQTKESSFEIRNLLDNRRYELEIALSPDVGKSILSSRCMNLLIVHTETMGEDAREFFDFLEDQGISIPIMILGEEAGRFRDVVPGRRMVSCFEKPYPVQQMISFIQTL
jgi:DNA-binding response OmpR family regulator